jgi:DNA polymerase I-like protein with 3'-5' exonuclease and polymerase domains
MSIMNLTPKEQKMEYERIKAIRKAYKATNYSAVYGVGVPTLARQMGITQRKAKGLLNAYWEKNHSVRKIADQQFVKKVGGYSWLKNPVSGFYYELLYDKDRFSTLNQGTGVYIFDSWLMRAKRLGYMGQAQFHDETAASVQDSSQTRDILFQAVDKLNQDLKLNVTIAIDMQVGQNYSETH